MDFTIESATNPVYSKADNTAIDLDVKFAEFDETLPFTATPDDVEEHGVTLYNNATNGDYGPIAAYVEPTAPVPEQVTKYQFGMQLFAAGIKDDVDAWVASQDAQTQWAYNNAGHFRRDNQFLQAGLTSMGYTSDDVDAFFVAAGKIT